MKITKWSQKVALLAALLVGGTTISIAQTSSQARFNQMATELHLTEKQKFQIAPILKEEKSQMESLKSNHSMTKRAKLQKYMQIQDHFHYQASQVLNEKQLAGLEEMQKQERRQMIEQRGS